MTEPDLRAEAVRLYDRFTHEHLDRRRLMGELARLTGSAATAAALLPLLAANPAAAAQVAEDDPRVRTNLVVEPLSTGRPLRVYHARAASAPRGHDLPAVIVIHENRGLNPHIRDIARRLALAGYLAVAPDFLTVAGGTPPDEDRARQMIAALDRAQTVGDAAAFAAHAREEHKRAGAVGFCWGGGMVNALAAAAGKHLDAGVAYYGPAPDPADARRIEAAMLFHRAGNDERINAGYPAFEAALKAAGARYTDHVYPGVEHAFNNDTAVARYNRAVADLAWQRTLAFLARHLKGA